MAKQTVLLQHFPVGYHALHPDVAMNFQMNRFWNWVGEDQMLAELREVAARIRGTDDWIRELLELGDRALQTNRRLPAAYFFRMAEFFMNPKHPRHSSCREAFLELVLAEHRIRGIDAAPRALRRREAHGVSLARGVALRNARRLRRFRQLHRGVAADPLGVAGRGSRCDRLRWPGTRRGVARGDPHDVGLASARRRCPRLLQARRRRVARLLPRWRPRNTSRSTRIARDASGGPRHMQQLLRADRQGGAPGDREGPELPSCRRRERGSGEGCEGPPTSPSGSSTLGRALRAHRARTTTSVRFAASEPTTSRPSSRRTCFFLRVRATTWSPSSNSGTRFEASRTPGRSRRERSRITSRRRITARSETSRSLRPWSSIG